MFFHIGIKDNRNFKRKDVNLSSYLDKNNN